MATHSDLPVVEVRALGKRYMLGDAGASTLRESFERWRNRPRRGQAAPNAFWALKDVSFEVQRGQVVGLLGRNGAGKSTLLKVLARITEPTTGRAILRGRVVSLLEVGTGFHPDLTGRENIFLNGAILGMKRYEIAAKFDEIVEFSEIGPFLDTPVKRYSSGMYVRLAFAVAAHLEPEILFVDEVLAVGDAAFQKKCLGKMGEVASQQGRTIFFVSHNMGAVRSLCDTAILLDHGRVAMRGAPAEVISHYFSSSIAQGETRGELVWPENSAPGGRELRLLSLRMLNDAGQTQDTFEADKPLTIEINYAVTERIRGVRFRLFVLTLEGEIAFITTDHLFQPELLLPGIHRSSCHLPGGLLNRRDYILGLSCDIPGERYVIPQTEYLQFTVAGVGNQNSLFPESWPGVVCPSVPWTVESLDAESAGIATARP
jgi:lipopolysaccharide transport system ATP-binding protein